MKKSCFVIMPIGDQTWGDMRVSAADLRKRYDDLIKEALLRANPSLEVTRADDIAMPGTITSDILTRIMHSDVVVVDVTYPNPNVFYELGLRHACRLGTILIREKVGLAIPFDISHQRCIEYENSPSGMKELSVRLGQYMEHYSRRPDQPDNQLQELAKLTKYSFPRYDEAPEQSPEEEILMEMLASPHLVDLFSRQRAGEPVDQKEILSAIAGKPKLAGAFAKALVKSGQISFGHSPSRHSQSNRAQRRSKKAGR